MDERFAGDDCAAVLVVRGGDAQLTVPGALPVVVCWIGTAFGASGPAAADLVLAESDLDDVLRTIGRSPLAAVATAVHLRSVEHAVVEHGLATESAVYSVLQSGPEFAAWRADASSTVDDRDGPCVMVARTDDVLTISLDRPHRHNAINTRLRDELHDALAIALCDDTIRAVELRGNGPSFCSGGDLSEFGSRPDPATAHRTRLARSPARLIHRLGTVTAFVHGATMGGGLEMAAFARRVVAHPDTRISLPEIGLGLLPGAGGTVSLSRRIGRQRTAALALTARPIDVPTARRWGLVDEIAEVPPE